MEGKLGQKLLGVLQSSFSHLPGHIVGATFPRLLAVGCDYETVL